jgi:hypothetical protein
VRGLERQRIAAVDSPVTCSENAMQKSKVQAMPGRKSAGLAKRSQGNPGKAGPKGALEEPRAMRGKTPASGPAGNEGNNTRRDFVKGPRLGRGRG